MFTPKGPWLFILIIKRLHSWRDSYWQFLMSAETWIIILISCGKETISQGDNYEANYSRWQLWCYVTLPLKLIAIWYVRITIYDYFYYCFCLLESYQKAMCNISFPPPKLGLTLLLGILFTFLWVNSSYIQNLAPVLNCTVQNCIYVCITINDVPLWCPLVQYR